MTDRPQVWADPTLLRTATVGYVLRIVWTAIALGALVTVVAEGPLQDPADSFWLRVGSALLVGDLFLWLVISALQYLVPSLGATGYATPLITGLPTAGQFFSQASDAVNHATAVFLIPFLVLLTGYTISVHVLVLRAQPRPGDSTSGRS